MRYYDANSIKTVQKLLIRLPKKGVFYEKFQQLFDPCLGEQS